MPAKRRPSEAIILVRMHRITETQASPITHEVRIEITGRVLHRRYLRNERIDLRLKLLLSQRRCVGREL